MKQLSGRMIRHNNDFAREIAEIIRSEIKDPRVGAIVSVMKTDTSVDLKHCKVYVSVLGSQGEQSAAMEGLQNAAGFIRKRVAERINPRHTPELKFVFDNTMEYGFKMDKLIEDTMTRDAGRGNNAL